MASQLLPRPLRSLGMLATITAAASGEAAGPVTGLAVISIGVALIILSMSILFKVWKVFVAFINYIAACRVKVKKKVLDYVVFVFFTHLEQTLSFVTKA